MEEKSIVPKKLLMCMFVVTLAVGCSGSPTPIPLPPVTQVEVATDEALLSAADWLQQAEAAKHNAQVQLNLLKAATAYLDQQQHHQAGVILIKLDLTPLTSAERSQVALQKARFYAALNDWPHVTAYLDGLEQNLTSRNDRIQVMRLAYLAAAAQNQHQQAAEQLILLTPYLDVEANPLAADEANELQQQIWTHLRQVKADYWRHAPRSLNTDIQGWYSLLERLTLVLDQQLSFSDSLTSWQQDYPQHPAQSIVTQLLKDPTLNTELQRVAVLLPLSGPLEKQGHAVRLGILAALGEQEHEQTDVYFIDTQQEKADDILRQLETLQIQFIIGPLDRAMVEQMAERMMEPVAQHAYRSWLQLALNHAPELSAEQNLPAKSNYFALDLAAETQAAAAAMEAKNYQGILLFGPDTNRGRQLSELFSHYWLQQQPTGHIQTGFYHASNEMRTLVRHSLDVAQSEERKSRLEQLIPGQKIEMEFRNRQDIDAIYLLGDATQARLLKPFIDVSLSAFSEQIPVYANSTVHEERQTQGESDLSGIRFADAPWLLPQHPKHDLHTKIAQLQRQWNRSEQRLTAMGYDSIQIAPRLALMQYLSGYSYQGLSGQLRIDGSALVRELSWAMFKGEHIILEP